MSTFCQLSHTQTTRLRAGGKIECNPVANSKKGHIHDTCREDLINSVKYLWNTLGSTLGKDPYTVWVRIVLRFLSTVLRTFFCSWSLEEQKLVFYDVNGELSMIRGCVTRWLSCWSLSIVCHVDMICGSLSWTFKPHLANYHCLPKRHNMSKWLKTVYSVSISQLI